MKFLSGYFGELDVAEDKIIQFNSPIPGFEEKSKYFMIMDDADSGNDGGGLFCWLHSAEDGDVAFALLDVFKVKNDYQPEIEEEYLEEIQFSDGDEILVYNIVNIPEKLDDMTVNLLAPIVLNMSKMIGMQVVLSNEVYSLKHRIFDDIRKISGQTEGKEV